ncbi:GGDEF domain-containing protein [Roseibium sp.]|uniref:GGDEF domain-containing protein n=1 Tax=Roseibium sp. TaxID=1936156 RepID=UPI003D134C16
MTLDTPTLLIALAAAEFASALILFAFLVSLKKANRATRLALAIYAPAMLLVACGTVLVAFRSEIPDFWSIAFGNTLILAGFALRPEAVAVFFGRPMRGWTTLIALGGWTVICIVPEFFASFALRLVFVQSVLLAAAIFSAWRVLTLNSEHLTSIRLFLIGSTLESSAYIMTIGSQFIYQHESLKSFANPIQPLLYMVLLMVAIVIVSASLVAMAIERIQIRFETQALTDSLTGLANRRAFIEAAEGWFSSTVAEPTYTLILIDIDHFKTINDRFGHSAGDRVLASFGTAMQSIFPRAIPPGRIGGEEFAALLPQTNKTDALKLLDELRCVISKCSICPNTDASGITVSAGLFTATTGHTFDQAFEHADQLLYQAKEDGRNRHTALDKTAETGSPETTLLQQSEPFSAPKEEQASTREGLIANT